MCRKEMKEDLWLPKGGDELRRRIRRSITKNNNGFQRWDRRQSWNWLALLRAFKSPSMAMSPRATLIIHFSVACLISKQQIHSLPYLFPCLCVLCSLFACLESHHQTLHIDLFLLRVTHRLYRNVPYCHWFIVFESVLCAKVHSVFGSFGYLAFVFSPVSVFLAVPSFVVFFCCSIFLFLGILYVTSFTVSSLKSFKSMLFTRWG